MSTKFLMLPPAFPQSFSLPTKPAAYLSTLQYSTQALYVHTQQAPAFCISLSSHSQSPLASRYAAGQLLLQESKHWSLSTSWAWPCRNHMSTTDDDFPFLPSTFIPQLPAASPPHSRPGIDY
ncbi:hypothetical protein J3459_010844 [Metarhizium acridum]|nr:hypothetical protein J3459_010844 [Metarhizium acridum]